MTDFEKIVYGEDIAYDLEYQAFDAKSTTSDKKGVVFEFTVITENNEIYVVKIFSNEDGSIEYLGVDENTFGTPTDILNHIQNDEEDFKEKVCEFIVDIIENL